MSHKPSVEELWMLYNPTLGDFALAQDDPDPYEAFLCTKTFEAIVALQRNQQEQFGITLVPIQVKP